MKVNVEAVLKFGVAVLICENNFQKKRVSTIGGSSVMN